MFEATSENDATHDNDVVLIEDTPSLERQAFDLRQLLEIAKSLGSTLDLHTILGSIMYTCMAQMHVAKAGIFVPEGIADRSLRLHREAAGFPVHGDETAIEPGTALFTTLETRPGCYTLAQLHAQGIPDRQLATLDELAPELIVSVVAKTELRGVLLLGDRLDDAIDFSRYARSFILDLAALAGAALDNALLFEATNTDRMTQLKLRHFFDTILDATMTRLRVEGSPFAVAMLDLDHFKSVNDNHGHHTGDTVIRQVAATIAGSIRRSDTAARYGGEEFVLLLPRADASTTDAVCERIRSGIQQLRFATDQGELCVTISIGIAQFDTAVDTDPATLLRRADQALYASKRNGRNRVTSV